MNVNELRQVARYKAALRESRELCETIRTLTWSILNNRQVAYARVQTDHVKRWCCRHNVTMELIEPIAGEYGKHTQNRYKLTLRFR